MKRTGRSTQDQMMKLFWIHDQTGLIYNKPVKIEEEYPELSLQWFNADLSKDEVSFVLEDDSKQLFYDYIIPIAYSKEVHTKECVVAFDEKGRGVVFHRNEKLIYTEKELMNVTPEILKSSQFYHQNTLYGGLVGFAKKKHPSLKLQVHKVYGDDSWKIGRVVVEGIIRPRCGGSCTPLLVFTKDGTCVIYY